MSPHFKISKKIDLAAADNWNLFFKWFYLNYKNEFWNRWLWLTDIIINFSRMNNINSAQKWYFEFSELLEKVLLRAGFADSDEKFEKMLFTFLTPVLLKIDSENIQVKNKVSYLQLYFLCSETIQKWKSYKSYCLSDTNYIIVVAQKFIKWWIWFN